MLIGWLLLLFEWTAGSTVSLSAWFVISVQVVIGLGIFGSFLGHTSSLAVSHNV